MCDSSELRSFFEKKGFPGTGSPPPICLTRCFPLALLTGQPWELTHLLKYLKAQDISCPDDLRGTKKFSSFADVGDFKCTIVAFLDMFTGVGSVDGVPAFVLPYVSPSLTGRCYIGGTPANSGGRCGACPTSETAAHGSDKACTLCSRASLHRECSLSLSASGTSHRLLRHLRHAGSCPRIGNGWPPPSGCLTWLDRWSSCSTLSLTSLSTSLPGARGWPFRSSYGRSLVLMRRDVSGLPGRGFLLS